MHNDNRYQLAAAAGRVGIWDWDVATGELFGDPILKGLLGYADQQIRDHIDDWARLVHPDDAAAVRESARAHVAGQTPVFEVEHRMLHRDGHIRWFFARGSAIKDTGGRTLRVTGTATDITDRKRGEEALRQAEEIHRRIVESTNDCVKILDREGRLLHINRGGLNLLGIPDASSLLNRPMVGFLEVNSQAAETAVAAAREGRWGQFQAGLRTQSGLTLWLDTVVTPIMDANGSVAQLLAVSRDITERRREEAFRAIQHRMFEMIAADCPLSEALDYLVHAVEQLAGGMLCSVLLLDDDGARVRHGAAPSLPADYVRAIDGLLIGPRSGSCGTAMFLGERVVATDISMDPLWESYRSVALPAGLRACWSQPFFSPQQRVLGAFAMYYGEPRAPREQELRLIESAAHVARIAIEQHRSRQALRHSEARTRAILRAIPDWMFLMSPDGVFLDYHARDATHLVAAPSQFLGKNVRDILPAPIAEEIAQAFTGVMTSDEPVKVEYALGSDAAQRFYEARIVRCDGDKVLSIVHDVTDRKRMELEAIAQRLELAHLGRVSMLGELTGTLAHELSQPLTAILGNAQAARNLMDREPIDAAEVRDALDDIIKNNRRAGAVIDHLRALLRKEDSQLQPVDLNDVVREVVDLARGELLSRGVTVLSAPATDAPPIIGNRVQLQQVVLNLVLNACDAMEDTPTASRHLSLEIGTADGFVQLAVSDRGTGIPPDQIERVFEPFVSFRKDGLGLGLAITRSIVDAHGGSIRAENNADRGATFRCFFRIADARALENAI